MLLNFIHASYLVQRADDAQREEKWPERKLCSIFKMHIVGSLPILYIRTLVSNSKPYAAVE